MSAGKGKAEERDGCVGSREMAGRLDRCHQRVSLSPTNSVNYPPKIMHQLRRKSLRTLPISTFVGMT